MNMLKIPSLPKFEHLLLRQPDEKDMMTGVAYSEIQKTIDGVLNGYDDMKSELEFQVRSLVCPTDIGAQVMRDQLLISVRRYYDDCGVESAHTLLEHYAAVLNTCMTAYAADHDMRKGATDIITQSRMRAMEHTITVMWVLRDMLDELTLYETRISECRGHRKSIISRLKRLNRIRYANPPSKIVVDVDTVWELRVRVHSIRSCFFYSDTCPKLPSP